VPNLNAFSGVSQGWINQIAAIATGAVRDAIDDGADFMREGIKDSPTGSTWHKEKNDANPDFADGARIGNRNPMFKKGEVDPNSGLMLASVSSAGPVRTGGGSAVEGFFGWIDTKQSYFLLQDVGNYGVGKQTGMGLLNKTMKPNSSITQMGAKVAAEQSLTKAMLAAGFKTGATV
jgi:hypothetical protein